MSCTVDRGSWIRVGLAAIGCVFLGINIAVNGWYCWGAFRPGGGVSGAIYLYEAILGALGIPRIYRNSLRIRSPRLRFSVLFVCFIIVTSHVLLTLTVGSYMLTSAPAPNFYNYFAFLVAVFVSVTPMLVGFFVPRV